MQIDSGTLFLAVAAGAVPPLIAFSYGYGKLTQKVAGLGTRVDKGFKAIGVRLARVEEKVLGQSFDDGTTTTPTS